jgi:hypothetical protein
MNDKFQQAYKFELIATFCPSVFTRFLTIFCYFIIYEKTLNCHVVIEYLEIVLLLEAFLDGCGNVGSRCR